MIRSTNPNDAEGICNIYNYYIANSTITFEEETVSSKEMKTRIEASLLPWIVFEHEETILGYAYAKPWKARAAYRHSAEISIYLKHDEASKGLGTILYGDLIERLKKLNFHAIMGGIALPNDASIALHKKFGFQKTAHFKEVGFKFNTWVDVSYWQLLIH